MLDADIAIELLRNKPEAWSWLYSLAQLPAVSVFTVMELLIGCQSAKERKDTLTFLVPFVVVYPTETGMKDAIDLSRLKLSHGLSGFDCLIAATAIEYGTPLYTWNIRHFGAVPGLTVTVPYVR